jgi:ABC-type antimicrobial peptide transport system permease subunit
VIILAAAGLAIGILAALGTSKLVASFLSQNQAQLSESVTLAILALFAAALPVGYLPARRASRIDPIIALGHE